MKVIKFLKTSIIASILLISLSSFSNQIVLSNLTDNVSPALNSTLGEENLLNSTDLGIPPMLDIDVDQMIQEIINTIPLIPVSSFANFTSSSMFKNALGDAFMRLYMEFAAYYMKHCSDDRVEKIFGPQETKFDASFACQELTMDWAQVYDTYKCNNWICNLKGTCSFKTDDMNFVIPSCSCNAGYAGQNCMFNQTTYQNTEEWITTARQWLQNHLEKETTDKTITQSQVVSDLLEITENIIVFSSNANPSDLEKYGNTIGEFALAIITSNVTMNSDLEAKLFEFVDFIFSNIDSSLQGVDPTLIAGMVDEPYKVTDKYEMQKTDIPAEAELILSPKLLAPKLRLLQDLSVNPKQFLQRIDSKRLLQDKSKIQKPKSKKTFNPDSAKAVLPKLLTNALTNSTATFVLFKDPSSMTQLNSVSISSQIINLKVTNKATGALVTYPTNSGSYQVYLPWAQVPLNMLDNNYVNKCKVYSFDGKTWTQTQSCTVLSTTNSAAANIECKTFGTLGVSCSGATVSAKKTNASSFLSVASFIIYAVLGFILF